MTKLTQSALLAELRRIVAARMPHTGKQEMEAFFGGDVRQLRRADPHQDHHHNLGWHSLLSYLGRLGYEVHFEIVAKGETSWPGDRNTSANASGPKPSTAPPWTP